MIINIAENTDWLGHIQFNSCSQIYSCGQSLRIAPALFMTKVNMGEHFVLFCLSQGIITL